MCLHRREICLAYWRFIFHRNDLNIPQPEGANCILKSSKTIQVSCWHVGSVGHSINTEYQYTRSIPVELWCGETKEEGENKTIITVFATENLEQLQKRAW